MVGEFRMFAPDQSYTEEYLQKLWDNYSVIYDPKWCFGIRIIPREGNNPLFEILGEDDGQLFSYDQPFVFDLSWADGIVECLEEAKIRSKQLTDSHCKEQVQNCSNCVPKYNKEL